MRTDCLGMTVSLQLCFRIMLIYQFSICSYSHLQQIESDAFINNKHLAVVDLSHNHLDTSSLVSFRSVK